MARMILAAIVLMAMVMAATTAPFAIKERQVSAAEQEEGCYEILLYSHA